MYKLHPDNKPKYLIKIRMRSMINLSSSSLSSQSLLRSEPSVLVRTFQRVASTKAALYPCLKMDNLKSLKIKKNKCVLASVTEFAGRSSLLPCPLATLPGGEPCRAQFTNQPMHKQLRRQQLQSFPTMQQC